MTRGRERDLALREAMRAANRLHARLGLDLTQPVDVYGVIDAQDLWLAFQPLGQVYGLYLNSGTAAGIVVNAQHPQSLQRFTAAHELGHHILRHPLSLDDASNVETLNRNPGSTDLIEQQADLFAAYFLMPLKLVNYMLRRLNLDPATEPLGSREIYQLSLALSTSYEATVWHLTDLGKIPRAQARALLNVKPVAIKQELRGAEASGGARSDVWWLDEEANGQTYQPRVNDEVILELPETPSSGYRWTVRAPRVGTQDQGGDPLPLVLEEDRYQQPAAGDGRVGGSGQRHLAFRVRNQGEYALLLVRQRPWAPDAPSGRFEVQLQVVRPPTGDVNSGFYVPQRQRSLIAHA